MSSLMNIVARRSSFFLTGLRQNIRMMSTPVETPKPDQQVNDSRMKSANHKVDDLERRMLVWVGKYKTADEVPDYIK